ncbi:MAG: hypothetical protein LBB16_03340 [Puniceicoccales bacterium]|jgi:hypothetical protein|nr:hypothetical protein [Puniceicoccales bacterium]
MTSFLIDIGYIYIPMKYTMHISQVHNVDAIGGLQQRQDALLPKETHKIISQPITPKRIRKCIAGMFTPTKTP